MFGMVENSKIWYGILVASIYYSADFIVFGTDKPLKTTVSGIIVAIGFIVWRRYKYTNHE